MFRLEELDQLDYYRKMHAIYAGVRDRRIPAEQRWQYWVAARNELLGGHPHSPVPAAQRAHFINLAYYAYDPALRFVVDVDIDVQRERFELAGAPVQRVGRVLFPIAGSTLSLSLFSVRGYGGGLLLPFVDASARSGKTYAGARWLLDTPHGADLGEEHGKLVLDFNFAYNPASAYDPAAPRHEAPPENVLALAVPAGEQAYPLAAA
ncbi:MAG: DUF1684 domain-containing protein [Anaerolineales bacterium]|nr:DUF1684 domain-containing protein [Anaerolineales bacterium]